jgi:hypothetical protein
VLQQREEVTAGQTLHHQVQIVRPHD